MALALTHVLENIVSMKTSAVTWLYLSMRSFILKLWKILGLSLDLITNRGRLSSMALSTSGLIIHLTAIFQQIPPFATLWTKPYVKSKYPKVQLIIQKIENASRFRVGLNSVKTTHTSESYIEYLLNCRSVTGSKFKPKISALISFLVLPPSPPCSLLCCFPDNCNLGHEGST